MSLERLRTARKKSIGTKQTAKSIEKGSAKVVYIAKDAEEHVVRDVLRAARDRGLEVVQVETMLALGKACGIEVGAAVAAVLEA
jgi:large subunit ribosomal protein L7A